MPTGGLALGAERLPRRVKANGEILAPGTYQLRLTIVPASDVSKVQHEPAPRSGTDKVALLKDNEYVPYFDLQKITLKPPPAWRPPTVNFTASLPTVVSSVPRV